MGVKRARIAATSWKNKANHWRGEMDAVYSAATRSASAKLTETSWLMPRSAMVTP